MLNSNEDIDIENYNVKFPCLSLVGLKSDIKNNSEITEENILNICDKWNTDIYNCSIYEEESVD